MCMCDASTGFVCGYHRRERCPHPAESRRRFWQSNAAVCDDCGRAIEWDMPVGDRS